MCDKCSKEEEQGRNAETTMIQSITDIVGAYYDLCPECTKKYDAQWDNLHLEARQKLDAWLKSK